MRYFSLLLVLFIGSSISAQSCNDVSACIIVNQNSNGSFLFENCSTPLMNSQFIWSFGDGQTASSIIADHVYSQPGTYAVCLTIYWQNCVDSACTSLTVGEGNPCDELDATFFYSGNELGMNFGHPVVTFDWTYYWSFGDGTSYYGPSPYHTYPGPGSYETCLIVGTWDPVTQDTCFVDHCEFVVIGSGSPCDNLNADFQSVTTSNGTQFSNGTTGTGFQTSWHWDFGDGSVSNDAQPMHIYSDPSTYTVCLVAVSVYEQVGGNPITCADTTCQTITIAGGNPCDIFQACFVPSQLGQQTFFFNNCTQNEQGTIFTWHFGDGTTSDNIAPTHTFPTGSGVYMVCLTALWQNCVDSTCTTVTVEGGNPCDELTANFTYSGGTNGMNFANEVINNEWAYFWEFGDGTTEWGPNPFHTYPGAGSYETCLTVWTWNPATQDTCFADHCELVVIGTGSPCDNLNAGFQSFTNSNGTQFTNTTTGTGFQTTWHWDFGDGGISDNAQPTHMYASPGTYTTCLTVISIFEIQGGSLLTCVDTICHTLTIQGNDPCDFLQACFVATQSNMGTVFFNNCSPNEQGTIFTWHFGDGSTSNDIAPTHTFPPGIGVFTVCLTAQWQNCVDSMCATITVDNTMGCDSFTTWFDVLYGDVALFFEAHTSQNVDGYVWDFGDGTEGYNSEEIHYFEPPGPYTVCLSTYYWNPGTQDTCWSTHCQSVNPYGPNEIADVNAEDPFNIYPLPANDVLTIDGEHLNAPVILRLFSMDGRLERTERVSAMPHRMDVSSLAKAVHILQLELDGHRSHYRIVLE